MLQGRDRQVGRFAWAMAWVGLIVGQLHALARFRTEEGRSDLVEYPATAAWAVPADDLLSPLLGWADADAVYVHYGKIWFPVFAAFTLCALVVYRRRRPQGLERLVWRAAIAAYASATVGVLLSYWTQWSGSYKGDGLEATLFRVSTWVVFPSLMLVLLTSTALGVTLLVRRFRPALPALLLTLMIPSALVITSVTSLGSAALPVMFAFGLLGRRIARAEAPRPREAVVA